MKPLEVKAYEIFKDKFGQENAETIVQFIGTKSITMFETHKDTLATKADINLLKGDLIALESRLMEKLGSLKADLIQWSIAFWLGSVGTIALLFKLFLGK